MNYSDYNDYELLSYVQENNEEATDVLYKKYEPLISSIAHKMYRYTPKSGIDVNDLKQEGRLGLSKAILEYKDSMNTTFYTFAKTCIERKIITAVIATRRLKHKFLNESLSLNIESDGKSISLDEFLGDNGSNPEYVLLNVENYNYILDKISEELTVLEKQVFSLRISGLSYKEIADILSYKEKVIDNCLQRIKAKAKKVLKNME